MWPSCSTVLAKIHQFLPKIDKVIVKVYKQGGETEINFKGVKVSLISTYKGTLAQQQLNEFLEKEKKEKDSRRALILEERSEIVYEHKQTGGTMRPISAKT